MKSKSINSYLRSRWHKKWLTKISQRKNQQCHLLHKNPRRSLPGTSVHGILSCSIEASLSQQSSQSGIHCKLYSTWFIEYFAKYSSTTKPKFLKQIFLLSQDHLL